MTHRFITLTNAVPGDEAGYAQWYVAQHLHDFLQIPGVLGGQFFTAADPERARWRHMGLYEVDDGEIPRIFEASNARAGGPQMPLHPMDRDSFYFLVAAPAVELAGVEAAEANCRLLALSRPLEGREQDLVRWYETQHFSDMLRVPGILGAQRFDVSPSGRGLEPPWRFAALYSAQAADPKALLGELGARRGTDQMVLTDALDLSVGATILYTALTPHLTAPKQRQTYST